MRVHAAVEHLHAVAEVDLSRGYPLALKRILVELLLGLRFVAPLTGAASNYKKNQVSH